MFIAIIVLLLICFIAGLIIKLGFAKSIHDKLDSIAATFIPGYKQMKTETIKQVDKKSLDKTVNVYGEWDSVMIKLNKEWKIVFIVYSLSIKKSYLISGKIWFRLSRTTKMAGSYLIS